MNQFTYRKLFLVFAIIGSLFFFSCSSSGGGDDEDFEFKSSDLTNKYWYANPYQNQKYSTDDAILVYRFSGGGDLARQEFSGRRDNRDAGSWSLSEENTLTINDETVGNTREYTIDKSSTKNHLFLKSSLGNWDFYTDVEELEDLTADAVVVNEVFLENGSYVSKYRYEFEVKGEAVSKAKVIVSDNESYELVQAQNSKEDVVWRLKENDAKTYFDDFNGEGTIKFYVKMNSGEEYKLVEQIYNQDIEALNYQSVDSDHTTGNGPLSLSVEWKAINDSNVFYYVQILSANKDENHPLFTSNWQPASSNDVQSMVLQESVAGDFGLSLGETFYVKVVAFLYEEGIDPYQGDIHEFNVQARSQFIKSGGEW